MKRPLLPSKNARQELAEAIAALSTRPLSIKGNQKYLALQSGAPPFCNVVSLSLHKDRVSFYIRSTQLMNEAVAADFKPEPAVARTRGLVERKYYFNGLKLADLQKHEPMFKAIVNESIDFVLGQKPAGK
ncbi:MAG: hypothetical protein WCF17_10415 [Terracidiphilus sp.]